MVLFVFSIGRNEISTSSLLSVHFWKWRVNIENSTYRHVTCLTGINAVTVIALTIPKLKLSRRIILTPPWHSSTRHTNLCPAQPTELQTEPVSHFLYWKSTSSPGSHPTENRTCRKDLWAAFVLWGVSYFLTFVFISHVVERKLWQDQQNAHSRWRFSFSSKCLMFKNDALSSSKIMLTNTGK